MLSFLLGSGLGDLHFFGVAMLLLFLHKLHIMLTVRKNYIMKTNAYIILSDFINSAS